MKKIILQISIFLLVVIKSSASHLHPYKAFIDPTNNEIETIVKALNTEIIRIQKHYSAIREGTELALQKATIALKTSRNTTEQVQLLVRKEELREKLETLNNGETAAISKVRYLKGLSIIKILYEKVLALDHHFASIATFNEINKISNPNHYPEFNAVKELIKQGSNKKEGLDLTSLLGENVYANMANVIVGLFNSNVPKADKQSELIKVECIMDFTLRMHQDLNTIYFETNFLQKSNDKIKADLEQLFVDFTKPINYNISLQVCRNKDDWDSVHENLQSFLDDLTELISDGSKQYKVHKMQINLEFPIDRLLQFITQYNNFIDQGGKFYEKFKIILDSYENESQCQSSLPPEYSKLKSDINIAIEKFNTAYKPVEINGSKMKEILYGINEYD